MKTMRRLVALCLVICAKAILPAEMRQWGHAMQCEVLEAGGNDDAVAFAWGCLSTSLRIAGSHYITKLMTRLLLHARQSWYGYVFAPLLVGMYIMFRTTMSLNDVFTVATLMFAAFKIMTIFILVLSKNKVSDLFASPIHTLLYFTSKISGILTVAFAMAAAASAGKTVETYVLAGGLLVATALTFWTIFARFTGQFYGFAQIGRPA